MTFLVDTSVWADHLRRGDAELARRLREDGVMTHRLVIEELACGRISKRNEILSLLETLPRAPEVGHSEFLFFVDHRDLGGSGLGAIDVHLLASAALAKTRLWTRDRALLRAAARLDLCHAGEDSPSA